MLTTGYISGCDYLHNDAGLYHDLDFDGIPDSTLPVDYIPKVGPYTGVGYYMIIQWRQ